MKLVLIATIINLILLLIVCIFQLCLSFGLPWGKISMGGKFPGKYPLNMRFVSFFLALFFIFIILIVLSKIGFFPYWNFSKIMIWFVVCLFAFSTIMNIITPSTLERKIWAPVSIILFITTIIIALN